MSYQTLSLFEMVEATDMVKCTFTAKEGVSKNPTSKDTAFLHEQELKSLNLILETYIARELHLHLHPVMPFFGVNWIIKILLVFTL